MEKANDSMSRALGSLNETTAVIEKLTNDLVSRLTPVLQPIDQRQATRKEAMLATQEEAPLVNGINDVVRRNSATIELLHSALNRLAV